MRDKIGKIEVQASGNVRKVAEPAPLRVEALLPGAAHVARVGTRAWTSSERVTRVCPVPVLPEPLRRLAPFAAVVAQALATATNSPLAGHGAETNSIQGDHRFLQMVAVVRLRERTREKALVRETSAKLRTWHPSQRRNPISSHQGFSRWRTILRTESR